MTTEGDVTLPGSHSPQSPLTERTYAAGLKPVEVPEVLKRPEDETPTLLYTGPVKSDGSGGYIVPNQEHSASLDYKRPLEKKDK